MVLTLLSIILLSQSAWAAPKKILIIRHGEKPKVGNSLSALGRAHARALVDYFKTSPDVDPPDVIFAMAPGPEDPSLRPIETVNPLAESLGLKTKAYYTRDQIKPLVKKILNSKKYDGKTVLICWEHDVIAKMAHDFGVDPKPKKWSDNVFNQVWEIDYSKHSKHPKVKNFRKFAQNISLPTPSSGQRCITEALSKK